jgi:hypothetical protein
MQKGLDFDSPAVRIVREELVDAEIVVFFRWTTGNVFETVIESIDGVPVAVKHDTCHAG